MGGGAIIIESNATPRVENQHLVVATQSQQLHLKFFGKKRINIPGNSKIGSTINYYINRGCTRGKHCPIIYAILMPRAKIL